MLLRFAFRNILRNKRRTFFTLVMISFGYLLLSFSLSLVDGSYNDIIELFTGQQTGHIQIHHKNYVDRPTLYKTVKNFIPLMADIQSNIKEIKNFSGRIKAGGLGFAHKKVFSTEIFGVDWKRENETTQLYKRIENREGLLTQLTKDIIIGAKLAKIFKLKINDELSLISQGADGSVANDIFIVKGVLKPQEGAAEDYRIYMDLAMAQEFFFLPNQVHEVAIKVSTFEKSKQISKFINLKLPNDQQLIARPWQIIESEFYRAMKTDKKGNNVSLFIILIMMGVGVFNTILMSYLERIREFGVLKALGTTLSQLARVIFYEVNILAILGCISGLILAYITNYYFSIHGISYGETISYGGMNFEKMRAQLTASCFYIPFIVILLTSSLVGLYPILKMRKISPALALREF